MNSIQRSISPTLLLSVLAATSLTGCSALEGIFKAGLWVGVVGILVVVAIIGGAVALLKK